MGISEILSDVFWKRAANKGMRGGVIIPQYLLSIPSTYPQNFSFIPSSVIEVLQIRLYDKLDGHGFF